MTCKFEINGPHRLTCRAVRKLLQAFTQRHVPCAMCHQSTHGMHHRRSGVLARRMVPRRARSDQPFGRYSRKCLDTHTDWPTNTSGQLFFTDPPVEIFVHRTFNAKAFERSFTTILDYIRLHPPPPGQQLLAKLGKMWWVVNQIWLNSDSNELSRNWVRLANLGSELSQSWVNQERWSVELSQSWVTWIVTWVRVESARKIWVKHNPDWMRLVRLSSE